LELPASLVSLSLSNCTALENLTLPDGLVTLSISGCTALKTLSIHTNVENITLPLPPETIRFTVRNNGEGNYATDQYGKILTKLDGGEIVAAVGLEGPVEIPEGTYVLANGLLARPAITSVILPSTITVIPQGLCTGSGITSITINGEVTEIGRDAFVDCINLSSITLPESLETIGMFAFRGSGLTSIVIPEDVTNIGMQAFVNCPNLATVTIQTTANYNTDGSNSRIFEGCSALTTVNFHQNTTVIPAGLFWKVANLAKINPDAQRDVNFPPNLAEIKAQTFAETALAGHITLPDSLQKLENAFADCTGITKITFPDSIVDFSPLQRCTGLVEFELTDTAAPQVFATADSGKLLYKVSESTKIFDVVPGNNVDIVVPAQFTAYNKFVFQGKGLRSIDFSGNTSWPTTNSGTTYSEGFKGCIKLETVILNTNATVITNGTFSGCESLTTVKMGLDGEANILTGITIIGGSAFLDCKALESIELPSITEFQTMGNSFKGCTALQSVTIGPNLAGTSKKIQANTFNGCTALTEVILQRTADVTPLANINAFAGCIALESIWVPASLVDTYIAATPWSSTSSPIAVGQGTQYLLKDKIKDVENRVQ
jgi:hypothetical protein